MSTKEWVSQNDRYGIYQECLYDHKKHDINPNPAVIQIEKPDDFSIQRETLKGGVWSQLTVEVPADVMDEFAIAWLKKRGRNFPNIEELLEGYAPSKLGEDDEQNSCD